MTANMDWCLILSQNVQTKTLLAEYEDDRDIGIYAIFPSNRYLLPKVQCFVEFLVKSCTDVV